MLLALLLTPAALADGRLLIVADSPQDIYVDGDFIGTETTAWLTLDEGYHRVRIGHERHRVWVEDNEESRIWFYNGVVDDGGSVRFKRGKKGKKGHHQRPDHRHDDRDDDRYDDWDDDDRHHHHGRHDRYEDTRPGTVQFISRDDEWVNIWVDGVEVAELRNFDSRRQSIELSPGYHTVEVWDFMNNECLVRGQVYVTAGGDINLGITEHRVEAYGDERLWVATSR